VPTHAENKQIRRQRLMDAARILYAESGVENTTMNDVARAAGCTRRTLYAYFESWEDLMSQVFVENLTRRWLFQQEAMAGGNNGLDRIRRWAQAYFAFARDNPEAIHLEMFRDYRGIEPSDHGKVARKRHEEAIEPLLTRMTTIFTEGQADGSIRPDLDGMTTLSHFAFSLRAVMNRVLSSGDHLVAFDTDNFVNSFIELFLRGIVGPAEAHP
jgi:AcrR family transcriptional regulator